MMRTWLNPVLELMTAEHRAMAFDLFCDWRACRLLRGFFFLCLRVKDSSVYQLTPARILHILTCFTCLFARMITLSFSTLTWSKQTRAWVCTQRNHNGGECAERRLGGVEGGGAGGEELGVTWNVGRLSRPGKSSMSPVATLKQAPCHGQRTCPFDSTPGNKQKRTRNLLNTYHSMCCIDVSLALWCIAWRASRKIQIIFFLLTINKNLGFFVSVGHYSTQKLCTII